MMHGQDVPPCAGGGCASVLWLGRAFGRVLSRFGSRCPLSRLLAMGGRRGGAQQAPSIPGSTTRLEPGTATGQAASLAQERLHPKIASPWEGSTMGVPTLQPFPWAWEKLGATKRWHVSPLPTPPCLGEPGGDTASTQRHHQWCWHPGGQLVWATGWVATGPALLERGCPALAWAQKDRDRVGYQ